jgi:predicted DNA-binding protein YlxM (UPF0122 family)
MNKYNWEDIQKFYDEDKSYTDVSIKYGVNRSSILKAVKRGDLIPRTYSDALKLTWKRFPRKHSEKTKQIISEKRKKYLKENPDKHPWRKLNAFKSEPCERFKNWLNSKSIPFIPEYLNHGVTGRNFSIDVAFPDKMIAIEVNGNQHYNRDGSLKTYYQERKLMLESVGWIVYDIHYSMCYHLDKHEKTFLEIINSVVKIPFDYSIYKEIDGEQVKCKDCGICVTANATRCESCHSITQRKVLRPTKSVLHNLVWEHPLKKLGMKYGVSDKSINKWCRLYGIKTPSRKFRADFSLGKVIDYQI